MSINIGDINANMDNTKLNGLRTFLDLEQYDYFSLINQARVEAPMQINFFTIQMSGLALRISQVSSEPNRLRN